MMKNCIQWIKHKSASIFSGLMIGTTYIPFAPWALLFCYAPLWISVSQKKSLKQVFWAGWITQFVLTLIGFHWIAYTAYAFGNFPVVFSAIVLIIFAALMHIYIPLALVFAVYLKNKFALKNGPALIVMALSVSLAERYWPSIFQWHLGYTLLWAKIPAYNWADMVGFEGLSTIILLLNAWLCYIWLERTNKNKALSHIAAFAALTVALVLGGALHGNEWSQFDDKLKVSIIQANISDLEKVYAEQGKGFQDSIIQKFLNLSQQAVRATPDTQLLMWPETAVPDYLDAPFWGRKNQAILAQGLRALQKPLLTGGYSKEIKLHGDHAVFNALFLLNSEGYPVAVPYRKTYLLAFGEYLPFSEQFPILLKWLPFISNFGRGPGPSVMNFQYNHTQSVNLGSQICYEGLYSDFSRGLSLKGAELLVNVTNDSWFGRPFEPNQHMYMTLARAIETRRPLIRSTNTGISTAILANGDVLQKSPVYQEWFGTYELPFKKNPPQTFYVLYGHWDWILILLTMTLLVLLGKYHEKSRRP